MLLPEVTSQNQTHALRDPPHATSVFPSGLNATDLTPSCCSSRRAISCFPVTSHSRTVLSLPPEARSFPSGLNATDQTVP